MKKYANLKALLTSIFLGGTFLSASITTPYAPDIEAVIFDCDGVLIDTEHLKFLAWQQALESKNILLSLEDYMPCIGHDSLYTLQKLQETKNQELPLELIQLKKENYQKLQSQAQGFPEMVAFAQTLFREKEALGIKLALASSASKEEILQNLKTIGLNKVFDVIVSKDDLEHYADTAGKAKPKPYIYMEVAKQLNICPDKCLALEDTQAGIQAATQAGMIAIAIPNSMTHHQDFSKATKVLSLVELNEILKYTIPTSPRYILALIPQEDPLLYTHTAQKLFARVHDGYLLSETSAPHITLCQFKTIDEEEVAKIWQQIQQIETAPIYPKFTGVSFIKGIDVHDGYYWAELSVAKEEFLHKLHSQVVDIIHSHQLICLNDIHNLYRPHLTFARIRLPEQFPCWAEEIFQNKRFKIALAKGDENGQYLYTIYESSSF